MLATAERSHLQLYTIGQVRHMVGRSATAIRRMEERGVVTPCRAIGHDHRLYTLADVETIKAALHRASDNAVEAV